ncbi:MAG: ATP-binding protein [Verrucomicrobiota bacterium]
MNLNSFRLKIALLSGLITGSLLIGCGMVLWQVSYQFNLDRLDRELRNLGSPHLERVLGGDHWVRFESALRFVAGSNQPSAYILWVKSEDRVIYQSPDWPRGLDPESLPQLTSYEAPGVLELGKPLPPPPRRGEEISARNPALPRKTPQFHTREAGGRTWRIGVMGNPYATLILGADIHDFNTRLHDLRKTYLAALPVVLFLAGLGAWFLAQRALGPVSTLTQTAERVTARGLDQRIPAMPRDQEFNRLITVFNEMLNRLETSFTQATRFSADASHELKTPLARLQVELEQALASAPDGSPQQEVYGSLLEEIHRLKAIVQKLLLLSLADAGRLQIHCAPVNLTRMLENIIEDCQAQVPALTIEHELASMVQVQADPDLLEQALQNLATNAIKYNCEPGRIRFELRLENEQALIRIGNTGPGISAADRERVFERFYRADQSRSGRVEGVGLGLSLAREIVRAHQGELLLEPPQENWTSFIMRMRGQPMSSTM